MEKNGIFSNQSLSYFKKFKIKLWQQHELKQQARILIRDFKFCSKLMYN